ncbi:MAG: Trp family transcriptional regulator [Patescibacteria group bacterium]
MEISKFKSRKEWEGALWQKFLEDIRKTESRKTAIFLDSILSENEKGLISRRLAAMALIKTGKTYREVGEILWISPSTISAIKKSASDRLNYKSSRYYAGQSKNEKRKNMKGLPAETIFDYWLNLPFPKKVGRGRWNFLNHKS